MNLFLASFIEALLKILLRFGTKEIKAVIAKSKADARIDSQVRELERVVNLPDNTNQKKELLINASRNLIKYHDS